VLSANGAALQMLRVDAGALAGRTLADAFAGDPRAVLAELSTRAAGDSPPRLAESVSFPVEGTWRSFDVRVTGLPAGEPGGAGGGSVLVLEDLTELIRAQKLATWTEAARRVAHEIKNPLTPIRLAAERLRARHRQAEPEAAEETAELVERSVDIIVREVANMQQLVDEFSRFARMPGPRFVEMRFEPLVEDVVALHRDLKTGVAVDGRVAADVGAVWAYPEQIRRVLLNLLANAVEATDAPGEVRVEVARRGDVVEMVVADSGRGIPAEDRDKVFQPFFSRKGRGSGMGLAIVQRLVADHDGTIVVEENAPRGTRFRIALPARGAAADG
jgi:nitrogen fixation/metabolism regulation signal transduction histidine kinase